MFLQPLMLFGLAALAIPIIIHLLNRRRYEVVDWGAMRFLQMSKVTRRRLFFEEILLMLMRMALLALLPLAFARLVWGGDWLAWMQPRPNRDVVLVFDGSSSMNYTGGDKTPQDAAKEWAAEYVKGLVPGDGVAVFQARQQVLPVVAQPSRDLKGYVPKSILRHAAAGRRLRPARGRSGGRRAPGQEPARRARRDRADRRPALRLVRRRHDAALGAARPPARRHPRPARGGSRAPEPRRASGSSTSIRTASPTRPTGRSTRSASISPSSRSRAR